MRFYQLCLDGVTNNSRRGMQGILRGKGLGPFYFHNRIKSTTGPLPCPGACTLLGRL